MGPVPCEKLLGRTINTIQEVMSGRVPSQTGYMTACPDHVLWQVWSVHLYIVTCSAAEHNHVPGWAGPGLDWGPGGNSAGVRSGTTGQMGPLGAMQAGQGAQYLPHPLSHVNIKWDTREEAGRGRRRGLMLIPLQVVGWHPPARGHRPHAKGGRQSSRDLWWDILNPSTWLLGLPSVGRYDAAAGTRPQGRTIYVNHFARALWVRTASAGKIGPLYRGPFPVQVLPRCRFADGRRDTR